MPSSLTADTTAFVLLSTSGTTPSISGYSGNLLVTAVASAGNVKIITQTNLNQAAGYCGHGSDSNDDITGCDDDGRTEIGFRGTQADINTGLATLSFKGDGSEGSPTITLSVTAAGNNYNSDNGHYYKVVDNTSNITWTAAKTAAEATTLNGLQGYLASVSSFAENTFIKSKTNGDSWIGGSDKDVEGCWKWTSGPDAGKIFQNGNHGNIGGVSSCVVDTGYAVQTKAFNSGEFGWNTNEPNDQSGEDYAYIKTDGSWNDYRNAQNVSKYVIE